MSVKARVNSFDVIRFVAATLVILSHSYALVGLNEPRIGNASLGGLSVWVFFILSGFLIAYSWKQYPRFNVFMAKRGLRIFPGLIVAILVTVFGLGLLSKLSYTDYLLNQQTLNYLNNFFMFNTQYSLPGVFENNVYPHAVNGSIWTLAYEFAMYGAVAILGMLSLMKKGRIQYVWLLLLALTVMFILKPSFLTFNIFYLHAGLVAQMGLMFFSGVMLQVYDKRLVYKKPYWISALIFFYLISSTLPSLTAILGGSFLAYGILGLAKQPWFSGFGKYGDFSYGLYIYAFPVQQTIVYLTQTRSPIKLFLLAFAVTLIFAVVSWYLVESRFIKLKKRIRHEDYPLSERHEELAHAW